MTKKTKWLFFGTLCSFIVSKLHWVTTDGECSAEYGRLWDIRFNSSKSYITTFGDFARISLDNVDLKRVDNLKYLGCFVNGHVKSILANKFYGYLITLCQLLVTVEEMRWLHFT